MTKDEALALALEALGNVAVTGPDDDGIVWINLPGNGTTGKAILRVGKSGLIAAQCAKLYEEQRTEAITAIKQALAAPVAWKWHQAPVKTQWGDDMVVADLAIDKDNTVSVYCESNQTAKVEVMFTPPAAKRQWVGLTDEEIQTEWLLTPQHNKAEGVWFGRRLEAKLKEKNA